MKNKVILPKNMSKEDEDILSSWGIQFLENIDDLSRFVIIPEGWSLERDINPYWTLLKDKKDRERASIFYKGAFYDRGSFIRLLPRYYAADIPERYLSGVTPKEKVSYEIVLQGNWYGVVRDGKKVIFKTNPIKGPSFNERDGLRKQGEDWLDQNFPLWKDKNAYWD